MPYHFSRSSIKFLGHTGGKIDDLDQIWARLLSRSQLLNPSHLPCCTCTNWIEHVTIGLLYVKVVLSNRIVSCRLYYWLSTFGNLVLNHSRFVCLIQRKTYFFIVFISFFFPNVLANFFHPQTDFAFQLNCFLSRRLDCRKLDHAVVQIWSLSL